MRGLRLVEEMEFQCVGLVFSSDSDKRVENAFEGWRRSLTTRGKKNRDAPPIRRPTGPPSAGQDPRQSGLGRCRWASGTACSRRQPKTSLSEPVGDQRFKMLPAADALHVFLLGQRRMPGEDLEVVKPAILDHQKPSGVAEAVEAANRARRTLGDRVIIAGKFIVGILVVFHAPSWQSAGVPARASGIVVRLGR